MDNHSLDALCKQLCKENRRYIQHAAERRLTDKSLVAGVVKATCAMAAHNIQTLQTDPNPHVWFLNTALDFINQCNNPREEDSDA